MKKFSGTLFCLFLILIISSCSNLFESRSHDSLIIHLPANSSRSIITEIDHFKIKILDSRKLEAFSRNAFPGETVRSGKLKPGIYLVQAFAYSSPEEKSDFLLALSKDEDNYVTITAGNETPWSVTLYPAVEGFIPGDGTLTAGEITVRNSDNEILTGRTITENSVSLKSYDLNLLEEYTMIPDARNGSGAYSYAWYESDSVEKLTPETMTLAGPGYNSFTPTIETGEAQYWLIKVIDSDNNTALSDPVKIWNPTPYDVQASNDGSSVTVKWTNAAGVADKIEVWDSASADSPVRTFTGPEKLTAGKTDTYTFTVSDGTHSFTVVAYTGSNSYSSEETDPITVSSYTPPEVTYSKTFTYNASNDDWTKVAETVEALSSADGKVLIILEGDFESSESLTIYSGKNPDVTFIAASSGATITKKDSSKLLFSGLYPCSIVFGGDESGPLTITGSSSATNPLISINDEEAVITLKANTTLKDNKMVSDNGGAVCVTSGTLNIDGAVITGNKAISGGGIYISERGNCTVSADSKICGNDTAGTVKEYGQNIYGCAGCNLTINSEKIDTTGIYRLEEPGLN